MAPLITIPRLRQSFKYRVFYGYCNLLKEIKVRTLPSVQWHSVDFQLPRFATITRTNDIPLLIYSLSTLIRYLDYIPPLWLVADSDDAYAALCSGFDHIPQGVDIIHWETLLSELDQNYQKFIRCWQQSGKWGGYSKKFTVTLAASLRSDLLFFDTDVLWFGNFTKSLLSLLKSSSSIIVGEDCKRSYDPAVAEFLGEPRIMSQSPLNCGVVYYPKQSLLQELNQELLLSLLPFAKQATTHFEQTLIAYAFWKQNGDWFPSEVLATTLDDNFSIRRKTHSLVRHYAGAKHLFWRDAY
ncbi:MAG: hypothetical protein HC921_22375 [Synechococcaceae cyanobacterium SM2_3_1]|nr:hypothetical protein [Synechococcaceae cyanobacterium SM2_3_1]